jgi:hypothetical protein
VWIASVRKPGDDTRALINKGQRFSVIYPFQVRGGVAPGLLFHDGDLVAPVFWLGLDDANGAAIHK